MQEVISVVFVFVVIVVNDTCGPGPSDFFFFQPCVTSYIVCLIPDHSHPEPSHLTALASLLSGDPCTAPTTAPRNTSHDRYSSPAVSFLRL